MIRALVPFGAGEDEGAQPGQVAVWHGRKVEVDLAHDLGERGDQARIADLVDVTGQHQLPRSGQSAAPRHRTGPGCRWPPGAGRWPAADVSG